MLDLLFAKLGIPLEEAQRSFAGEGCELAGLGASSDATLLHACAYTSTRNHTRDHIRSDSSCWAAPHFFARPVLATLRLTLPAPRRRHGAQVPAQPGGQAGGACPRLPYDRRGLQVVPAAGTAGLGRPRWG